MPRSETPAPPPPLPLHVLHEFVQQLDRLAESIGRTLELADAIEATWLDPSRLDERQVAQVAEARAKARRGLRRIARERPRLIAQIADAHAGQPAD